MVAAFSMAVALGYARVFAGWPFLIDMAVIVVAGHGIGLVLRRLRLDGMAGGAVDGAGTRLGGARGLLSRHLLVGAADERDLDDPR